MHVTVRRIATISKAHQARGLPNPCRSEIVSATLRGVKRTRGIAMGEWVKNASR